MTERFDAIEFDMPEPERAPRQSAPVYHHAPAAPLQPEPLLRRDDFETLLFALSVGGLTAVLSVGNGARVEQALTLAGAAAFGVPAYVYGSRVLGRSLPDSARALRLTSEIVGPASVRPRHERQPESQPEPALSQPEPALTHEQVWRQSMARFLLAGRLAGGFSIQRMVYPRGGKSFMSDTGWRQVRGALVRNGILATRRGATDYAHGYDYGRAMHHIKRQTLELPDSAAPEIRF